MKFSRNSLFNISVNSATEPTIQVSSVSYGGSTWVFDRLMPVGFFVTGEPFVVSNQAFSIVRVTPESEDVQGDGYVGNGLMLNPMILDSNVIQGFDAYFAEDPGGEPAFPISYDASLNLDPTLNGAAIPVALGFEGSYVKAVRWSGKTSTSGRAVIERYNVLTVLAAPPPIDPYRPGTAHTVKTVRCRADVVHSPRNHTLPAGWPNMTTILDGVTDSLGLFIEDSEKRNFMRIEATQGKETYSAKLVTQHAQYVYAANSNAVNTTVRETMIDRIITFGNDVEAAIDAGAQLRAGAGQGGCLWLWMMAAAALLRDNAMHQKLRAARLQPDTAFWISQADTERIPQVASTGRNSQPYLIESIGTPWIEPSEITGAHTGRYFLHASRILSWETIAVCGFQQGPAGFANGAEMILNGATENDISRPEGAVLGHAHRYRNFFDVKYTNTYPPTAPLVAAWDQVLGFGEFGSWMGVPDQPPFLEADLPDNYFSAGAGAVTLDTRGIDYATEVITRTDMRVSLDGIQWVERIGVTLSGGRHVWNGLLRGVPHQCGWRRRSASGLGPWSYNFPLDAPVTSGALRAVVTPTGTQAAAAPAWGSEVPRIHVRAYPQWEYETWAPAPSTLGLDDVMIAAGVGYPTGYPAPTYAYQWQVSDNGTTGWSDIAGATGAIFVRGAAQSGKFLRCDVTASNSSGSTTLQTGVVECPGVTVLSTGTLIDTNFRGAWPIDYAAENASLTSVSNFDITHIAAGVIGDVDGNSGYLFFDKTGNDPGATFDLSRPANPSTAYNVSGQMIVVWARTDAEYWIEIEDGSGAVLYSESLVGATDLDPEELDYPPAGQSVLWGRLEFSGQFVTGANTALKVRIRTQTSSSFFGGDIGLQQLTITEA